MDTAKVFVLVAVVVGVLWSLAYGAKVAESAGANSGTALFVSAIPGVVVSLLYGAVGMAAVTVLRMLRAIEQHLRSIARNTPHS